MSRILQIHSMIEKAKGDLNDTSKMPTSSFTREIGYDKSSNRIYLGDNMEAMVDLLYGGYREKFDLIYIDPPFFSGSGYRKRVTLKDRDTDLVFYNHTYKDSWEGGILHYLDMITRRLILMRELLSERGSIYVHVDYRTVHYMRLILDEIFGEDRFLNEIIWSYKSGGSSKKTFSRKHDNILAYTKTRDYIFNPLREKSYNRGFKPYRFKNVQEYQDEIGWHTMVNMRDVWSIDMVGRTSAERVGYETQKPEALIERIIGASTNEGSIVGDFFLGSGTTIKVAQRMNRSWIGADNSLQSIVTTGRRLGGHGNYTLFLADGFIESKLDFNCSLTYFDKSAVIRLEDIRIEKNALETVVSDPEKAKAVLEDNPERFVEYVGFYRIGEERQCIREMYGPIGDLEFIFEDLEPEDRILVRIVDIFGNLSEKELRRVK